MPTTTNNQTCLKTPVMSFGAISDTYGRKLWLIETSGMSEHQKENQRRVLSGLPEISEQQFQEQERYYQ